MNNSKIAKHIIKDISKRVSGASNFKTELFGIKSNLLDTLLLEKNHSDLGNKIVQELTHKIEQEKTKEKPRTLYIKNMQKILIDLKKRVRGEKTDDNRKYLLNLDKKQSFNRELLKLISDETIKKAEHNKKLHKDNLIKNLTKKEDYKKDILWFLDRRTGHIKNESHKKNISNLVKRIKGGDEKIRKNSKIQKTVNKVGITIGILLILGGAADIIKQKFKNSESSQTTIPLKANQNIFTEENIAEIEKINFEEINDTLLKNGITHEDLVSAVNNIQNEESKKEIIAFLNSKDVIGLQKYLKMTQNSEYTENKATGYIDKNTVDILKGGRFGLNGKEILENENITQDVKDAYLDFLEGKKDNYNKNYLIQSKICMHSFLFDKNHKLIDLQPILVGRDLGVDKEYLPFARYYENGIRKYYIGKQINRNTPEGLFVIEGTSQIEESHYKVGGPKIAILLSPKSLETEGLDYDESKIVMGIHPPFLPKGDENSYIEALNSETIDDNNKSKGCIDAANFPRIFENTKKGSTVYITQYNKYINQISKNQYLGLYKNGNKKKLPPKKRKA